jgi:hypothetical protein
MGLPAATVAEVRAQALTEGEHFEKKGARVLLTPAGVDALLILLAAPQPEPESPAPQPAHVVVVRQVPNATQVLARLESDPDNAPPPIVLKVPTYRDHAGKQCNHFRPGQRVPARHEQGAVWSYTGPRPRFPNDPICIVKITSPAS